jgi:hypothetical protein
VVISYLDCDFHQEAVIDLLQLSTDINSRIDDIVSIESTRFTNPAEENKIQPKALVNRGSFTQHLLLNILVMNTTYILNLI